ncbi:MAG: hypothetical protein IIU28_06695 [Lachnospiraceae bacterium]|nr:hypothetical protein [Lachnospiraceae bacterium]
MKKDDKEKLVSLGCLLLGILAYPLTCIWYLGFTCAIGSIVLGFYYGKLETKTDRRVIAGLMLSVLYLVMVLLFAIFIGLYWGKLGINPWKAK